MRNRRNQRKQTEIQFLSLQTLTFAQTPGQWLFQVFHPLALSRLPLQLNEATKTIFPHGVSNISITFIGQFHCRIVKHTEYLEIKMTFAMQVLFFCSCTISLYRVKANIEFPRFQNNWCQNSSMKYYALFIMSKLFKIK